MSEMTLEEALSMVDGGPHHIGEWAQAATILAAEVRRLQAENARMRGWRLDLYPDDPNAEAAEKGVGR